MQVRLEFHDDMSNSHKFWSASNTSIQSIGEDTVWVQWGRITSNGQNQIKQFDTVEEAEKFIIKKKNEKLTKGYVEV
jgi:predicted DNA-binding WGR domain protein